MNLGDLAVKYIVLDEANSGPNSIKFLRKVLHELQAEIKDETTLFRTDWLQDVGFCL